MEKVIVKSHCAEAFCLICPQATKSELISGPYIHAMCALVLTIK